MIIISGGNTLFSFGKSCLILDVIMNQNIAWKMFSLTSTVRQNWYLAMPCSIHSVKITLRPESGQIHAMSGYIINCLYGLFALF